MKYLLLTIVLLLTACEPRPSVYCQKWEVAADAYAHKLIPPDAVCAKWAVRDYRNEEGLRP